MPEGTQYFENSIGGILFISQNIELQTYETQLTQLAERINYLKTATSVYDKPDCVVDVNKIDWAGDGSFAGLMEDVESQAIIYLTARSLQESQANLQYIITHEFGHVVDWRKGFTATSESGRYNYSCDKKWCWASDDKAFAESYSLAYRTTEGYAVKIIQNFSLNGLPAFFPIETKISRNLLLFTF